MVNFFSMKSKFIFSIFLAGIFVFCFVFQVQSYMAPQIYVTELKINEIKSNVIKGKFVVANGEKYYLSDLNYEIKLFQGISFNELKLIDVNISKETFFISPEGSVTKSFTYASPQNIISGDYTLRAQIITERGGELGWWDEKVFLKGENKFLDILNTFSKVLVGEEKVFPLAGINVSSTEDVVGFLKVKNPGDAITVVPHIKIFQRQFNMPVVQEYQEAPITFAKNETKEINLKMPKLDIPESYLAEVRFYQDNEQVSGIQYFRWVVRGGGGKILYLKADKDYYKKGENIEITIESIGPADFSDMGEGKLEVIVSDKDGNFIAKISKDITLNPELLTSLIVVPAKKDIILPTIEAKLLKGENILDERSIKLPLFSQEAKALEKEILEKARIKTFLIYLFLSATVLILILVAGFLLYKFKIKKKK